MSIWVIGPVEVVTAFSMGGVGGREVAGRKQALVALDEIREREDVRVLAIEEGIAALVREEVDRLKLDPRGPLVVELPGIRGPAEERETALDLVRRALGIRL